MNPNYKDRIALVIEHIHSNLDGDLRVDALCRLANFSKYHFQRQFLALTGMSVHGYVHLARMTRAASWLAFRGKRRVTDIAFDCAYESPEAFSRAFRLHYGMSPTKFRQAPDWPSLLRDEESLRKATTRRRGDGSDTLYRVEIQQRPDVPVGVLRHVGPPAELGETLRRFIQWRRQAGVPPWISATFNLLYDDPLDVGPDDFRLDLCAACPGPVADNPFRVEPAVIPGGRWAALPYRGGDDALRQAASHLYGRWLPQSGESIRDFPLTLERRTFFPDMPECDAESILFLPLAESADA